MSPPRRRVAIIGLDGAEPGLVFDRLAGSLPTLDALRARGRWGGLASSVPPDLLPAWTCLATGQDPGQLGLYGPTTRASFEERALRPAHPDLIGAPALWDLADRAGLTTVALGMPLTFPPPSIRGAVVAGPPFSSEEAAPMRPAGLLPRLTRWAGGPYLADIAHQRPEDERMEVLEEARAMAASRFGAAEGLYAYIDPELFCLLELAPDHMNHAFWGYQDREYPGHTGYHPWVGALAEHYRHLDRLLGAFLRQILPGTLILVVSAYGCRRNQGTFHLNQWLMEKGYLSYAGDLDKAPAPLEPDLVDWPSTRAWGAGGYTGRVFLNISGRDPVGAVDPEEAPGLLAELKELLEKAKGPGGQPLGNVVLDPLRTYRATVGVPPDLILYPAGLDWRCGDDLTAAGERPLAGASGRSQAHPANHSPQGILIAALAGDEALPSAGVEVRGASLYDLFPSALTWLGLETPPGGPGRPWEWLA